jgi:hypothetical protein
MHESGPSQTDLTSASYSPPEMTMHHVFAMQRSGHHAVMAWLQDCYAQSGFSGTLINDVYHGHVAALDTVDPSAAEILAQTAPCDVAFVNYEDVAYSQRLQSDGYVGTQDVPGVAPRDMVLVRDWYNMAASRLKSIRTAAQTGKQLQLHDLPWSQIATAWQDHAGHMAGGHVTAISYNRWFADTSYRQSVAAQFGLRNSDATLSMIPSFGDGSSFDGMTYKHHGRRMGVLERWMSLPLDDHCQLIEISESYAMLAGLTSQLFGISLQRIKRDYTDRLRIGETLVSGN